MDHENGPLLRGEATKSPLELIPHRGRVLRIARSGHIRRGHVDLCEFAIPGTPSLAVTGVDEEPIEPGIESLGIAHCADVEPRRGK